MGPSEVAFENKDKNKRVWKVGKIEGPKISAFLEEPKTHPQAASVSARCGERVPTEDEEATTLRDEVSRRESVPCRQRTTF